MKKSDYEEKVIDTLKIIFPHASDKEFEAIMSKKSWEEWAEYLNIEEPKKKETPKPPTAEEIEKEKKRVALEERIKGMKLDFLCEGWYGVYKDEETGEEYIVTGCTDDKEDFDVIGKMID